MKHTQGPIHVSKSVYSTSDKLELHLNTFGRTIAVCYADPASKSDVATTEANAQRLVLAWNTLPEVESLLTRLLAFEQRLKAAPMDGGALLVADTRALLAKIKDENN